jgi:fructokinase
VNNNSGPESSRSGLPYAGVELGGTKCICTLAYGPGEVVEQHTVATTVPEETLAAIRAILAEWFDGPGFRALGVASFGPICLDAGSASYGRVLDTPKPGWAGADVLTALAGDFGVPCGFDTDVNAAALAEIAWGSGQGLADFAYVTVGTGVGVGLIVNGQPAHGLLHGELGHMLVRRFPGDEFAGACPFHRDCVEGLASGSAIKERVGADHIATITPDHPVWNPVVDALAGLVHNMVCATGPRCIAFGGGVMERQPHLIARIEARLRESLAGYITLPERSDYIVSPMLGGQAGPLGAIRLAMAAEGVSSGPAGRVAAA